MYFPTHSWLILPDNLTPFVKIIPFYHQHQPAYKCTNYNQPKQILHSNSLFIYIQNLDFFLFVLNNTNKFNYYKNKKENFLEEQYG